MSIPSGLVLIDPPEQGGERDHEDLGAPDAPHEHDELSSKLRRAFDDLHAPRGAPHPKVLAKRLIADLERFTAGEKRDERPRGITPAAVFDLWLKEGPLVHEPTGLDGLDDATGGGPVYGSRWYVLGAPDAGKTALLAQLAHVFAERGISVGLFAVDEEPSDIMTRFAQRVGFERRACEVREPAAVAKMRELLEALPLSFYGPESTIESAAADLARLATERKTRAMLIVDSIQTVTCDSERAAERELSEVQAIGRRVQAIRAAASEHKLIAITTSEMSRAAYKSINRSERIDPLAAGKWSGAIEYSGRVVLSLSTIKDRPGLIELEIPKNKHGRRRYVSNGDALYLEIDLDRQSVRECEAPVEEDGRSEEEREAEEAASAAKVDQMAERIVAELTKKAAHGIQVRSREDLIRLVPGKGQLKEAAVSLLKNTGRIEGGRGKPFQVRYPGDED